MMKVSFEQNMNLRLTSEQFAGVCWVNPVWNGVRHTE